ncbi:unannotated protein [freshwater metagenome]|jgi:hypothetical protein|uniref:Unannotated protein n=1 Tax=freshwater metagenome TaxID=449393 RepID=A0A6J6GMA6_9ZZZZ
MNWQLYLSIAIFAILAILISLRFRISSRYEREDKKDTEISNWKSLDLGIDPTEEEK